MYAHPAEHFNVHFPFRHGDLNIHSGVGGSLSSVLADLETIWGHCIVNLLEIPKSELKVLMSPETLTAKMILNSSLNDSTTELYWSFQIFTIDSTSKNWLVYYLVN